MMRKWGLSPNLLRSGFRPSTKLAMIGMSAPWIVLCIDTVTKDKSI